MGLNDWETPAKAPEEPAEEPKGEASEAAADDAATQLASVVAERDRLAADNAELKDRLLRRMAEFDNFRRRAEREKADIWEYAAMETLGKLLPVLDDFERALQTETADAHFAQGVELILQRFSTELQKLGLEPIPVEGRKFDPNVHHAIELRETAEVEDHTVLAELQKGYSFRASCCVRRWSEWAWRPPLKGSKPSEQAGLLRSAGRQPGGRRAGDQERLSQEGASVSSRPQSRQ